MAVANGADNISAYPSMFRTIGIGASMAMVMVLAVMVAVWCVAGSWLGSHSDVGALVDRHGRWLVPIVHMAIGALIVIKSNLLFQLSWRSRPSAEMPGCRAGPGVVLSERHGSPYHTVSWTATPAAQRAPAEGLSCLCVVGLARRALRIWRG